MSKRIARTVLRMNLEKEADRRAWVHLQRLDRKAHKSYSHAIVMAINDFFDRQERLLNDSYLETREKEDAFLQRVLQEIAKGFQGTAALHATTKTASMPTSNAEREEVINAALDFVNSL